MSVTPAWARFTMPQGYDFSYRQIAELTGVPIGTVMSRLARAREELQTAWFALEKKAKTK